MLLRLSKLPYIQGTTDSGVELPELRDNAGVQALRDLYHADLVLLVGNFPLTCGRG